MVLCNGTFMTEQMQHSHLTSTRHEEATGEKKKDRTHVGKIKQLKISNTISKTKKKASGEIEVDTKCRLKRGKEE